MTNSIPTIQNSEPQLRLMRASRSLYSQAKGMLALQVILVVLVPAIGAMLALGFSDLRPFIACAALIIGILDAAVIDHLQRKKIREAAKVQEQFDCAVLELPWNGFSVGRPVEPELVHEAASAYARHHDDSKLRNWYPETVGTVPLHLARIVCQRTNLWYDSKLRRRYGSTILGTAISLAVVLVFSGLVAQLSLTAFVIGVLAPVSPILIWSTREYYRQKEVADLLDQLRADAESLWARAKTGECDAESCTAQSREFQDAIFRRRSTSPVIFDWVYRLQRPQLEDQMNVGAEELLKQIAIT